MSIKSYTPPKLKLVDHRSVDGGYYTANCDVCNTEFYPKRSNAKYCSPKCAVVAHRMDVASGNVSEKTKGNKKTDKNTSENIVFVGKSNVIGFFSKKGIKTYGLQTALKNLEIGASLLWGNYEISRTSLQSYKLK